MTAPGYAEAVQAQWAARDERLRDPMGWLSLVGLWWLEPGANRFGADPGGEIVLRGREIPDLAGVLVMADDAVRLEARDASLTVDGGAGPGILRDDADGEPTMLAIGSLRLHLIRRGARVGLRVRDLQSPALTQFPGLRRYPLDPTWRLVGRLEPGGGRRVDFLDVTGAAVSEETPGRVSFQRDNRAFALDALPGDEDGSLWLIFADATNGSDTYGGGRYLVTEPLAEDGTVVADFNLAYNPPCVFSPHATCPLPPAQNRLTFRIAAGELAP